MTLLFITQKLHGQDAFGALWVRAFIEQGYEVKVLCLEGSDNRFEFEVHSMGKERGNGRFKSVIEFERMITSLEYDRVFVHMAPVWYSLGCWYWVIRRMPCYMWYTHYKMQTGVRLFGWFGKRFFCATRQSLPQYSGSEKKVVVGHGIDMNYWPKRENRSNNPYRLLMVHRLSRSKRVELSVRALKLLPEQFTLDIYGIEAEPDYMKEVHALILELGLGNRITFHGTVPMDRLPEIYVRHRLSLNMASETIDKTMLEAMTCGCYPVTTKGNAEAIGIPEAPDDSPEEIAGFIHRHFKAAPISADKMYEVVVGRHSLKNLIARIDGYISAGN